MEKKRNTIMWFSILVSVGVLIVVVIAVLAVNNTLSDWSFAFNSLVSNVEYIQEEMGSLARQEDVDRLEDSLNDYVTEKDLEEILGSFATEIQGWIDEAIPSEMTILATDSLCPLGPELQPLNPEEFDNGTGKIYGILAFGKMGCWYSYEGESLFQGWRSVHEIHLGFGAQELWPDDQSTVRIYQDELDPLEEAKKLSRDKCSNVEEDEKLKFVPIEWYFHGEFIDQFTCEEVYNEDWPEVPAELLQPQDDNYPHCYGVPNGDPVCGDDVGYSGEDVVDGCPVKDTLISASQVSEYEGCTVLFDGRFDNEELVHRLILMKAEDVSSYASYPGSFWVKSAVKSDEDVVLSFMNDKCTRDLPSGYDVVIQWLDGRVDPRNCP